jgi:hypothetical protein
MNMKSLTVILGALSAFALGACTVTSTTGSTGGSDPTTTTGGVGGSGGSGTTGTGGAAPCEEKYTCSEALDGDPTKLCDGEHGDLYDAYYNCTCVSGGACFSVCSDNACTNGTKSAECTACLQKADMGCAKELEACAGDAPN